MIIPRIEDTTIILQSNVTGDKVRLEMDNKESIKRLLRLLDKHCVSVAIPINKMVRAGSNL